jgi:hypothetical protein
MKLAREGLKDVGKPAYELVLKKVAYEIARN